jgi:hypothetical protein
MTKQKKPFAYYLTFAFAIIALPLAISGLLALKVQWMNDTLLSDIIKTASNGLMIMIELTLISDVFKYDAGYTEVVTTEYKLFKCRESGDSDHFMMFADSEEELQLYFDTVHPNKKFLIEEAQMNAKSINMKILNGDVEYEEDENSDIHSKS